MTCTEMADDIMALADELALEHFSLVGHSMGGKIAMEVAMRYEDRVQQLFSLILRRRLSCPSQWHSRCPSSRPDQMAATAKPINN